MAATFVKFPLQEFCGRSLAELSIMRSSSELCSRWQKVEVNGLLWSFFLLNDIILIIAEKGRF